MREMPTRELTRTLEHALTVHQPPLIQGRRIKLRYAHQGGSNPPRSGIHGIQTDSVPDAYTRYLANIYRKKFDLFATPVVIEYRTDRNPYVRERRVKPRADAKPSRRGKNNRRRRHHDERFARCALQSSPDQPLRSRVTSGGGRGGGRRGRGRAAGRGGRRPRPRQ